MKSRETIIDILANSGLLSNIQPRLPGFLLARKLLCFPVSNICLSYMLVNFSPQARVRSV